MKVLVAGLTHMSGKARATGNDYSMYRAHLLSEQHQVDTTNRVLSTIGLNPIPMDVSEKCFAKFQAYQEQIQFPAMLDLEVETDIMSGQPRPTIVDFKAPLKQAS